MEPLLAKILIFKIGAIGDVLMTTPMVRQLREAYPEAIIDYATGKTASKVLQHNQHISNIIPFDEEIFHHKKVMAYMKFLASLRKKQYDAVFFLDKHPVFHVTAWLLGVNIRIGFTRDGKGMGLTHKVPYGKVRHEIDYYLDLLDVIKVKANHNDKRMDGSITNEEQMSFDESGIVPKHPFIVIANSGGNNPGEKGYTRRMPDTLVTDLVKIACKTHHIVFVGSPAESSYYEQFMQKNSANLAGKLALRETMCLLSHANCIITTDCGIMHMAAAMNDRVVAVFGPTNPARKCPPRAQSIWMDQDIYEETYETHGKQPDTKKKWFTHVTAQSIMEEVGKCSTKSKDHKE